MVYITFKIKHSLAVYEIQGILNAVERLKKEYGEKMETDSISVEDGPENSIELSFFVRNEKDERICLFDTLGWEDNPFNPENTRLS